MRTEELKKNWRLVEKVFSTRFADGEPIDVDGILFILGVQEIGQGYRKYKKNEKVDLIHVAICRLLEPYGYYSYEGTDEQGWPHFISTASLPYLSAGEQSLLIKEAIVSYCKENNWI
jgi:hypothetical protein